MCVVDFQVGAGLAAVGIAERDVHARHFFVLQQDADHVAEREVGAEGELADAIAVLVGVAVVPELPLELLPLAVRGRPAARPRSPVSAASAARSPYFGPK